MLLSHLVKQRTGALDHHMVLALYCQLALEKFCMQKSFYSESGGSCIFVWSRKLQICLFEKLSHQ